MLSIRKIRPEDKNVYVSMATAFYHSPAVLTPVPASHFEQTFDCFVQGSPYGDAFILEADHTIIGYGVLAYTYSQEAGGRVVWLEEIYLDPAHRTQGYGTQFIEFVLQTIPAKRYRLETEPDNVRAAAFYRRCGFEHFEYVNYKLDI